MAELLAVVGQHRVDVVGHVPDQITQEVGCNVPICLLIELGEGKLRGSVDRDEEIELELFGSNFADVDVEVADRVVNEALRLACLPMWLQPSKTERVWIDDFPDAPWVNSEYSLQTFSTLPSSTSDCSVTNAL